MIPVLRKVGQLNIEYRKKWGPHNRYLHRGPSCQSYDLGLKSSCLESTSGRTTSCKTC